MRTRRHRSIRSWLTLTAVSAVAGSGLALISAASAAADEDHITVIPNSGTAIGEVTEGNGSGLALVGKFTDTGNPAGANTNCSPTLYSASIDWGDGTTSAGVVACEYAGTLAARLATGIFDVGGSHVYTDSGPYNISITVTDTEESETSAKVKTDSASISDAALSVDGDNRGDGPFVRVEGTSLEVQVAFFDENHSFPEVEGAAFDAGITTSIDWGDGSPVQAVTPTNPPDVCDCFGDVWVSATHVYDAPQEAGTEYTITVTAKDDGGSTVSDTLKAKVSDATLTAGAAKNFVAPAAQAATHTVASFTDAAGGQAAVADFSATIKWGDNATSAGTVTKTADGKFDVSGSHTYATAGTKALTITVTDEEGQTLTMTATATVPALPATGQPQAPVQPAAPPLALLALLTGVAIAGGAGLVLRRIRN